MKKQLPKTTQRELDTSVREIMGEWLTDHDNQRANRRIQALLRRQSVNRVHKAVESYAQNARIAQSLLAQQFPNQAGVVGANGAVGEVGSLGGAEKK
jgi:hypothetical protein